MSTPRSCSCSFASASRPALRRAGLVLAAALALAWAPPALPLEAVAPEAQDAGRGAAAEGRLPPARRTAHEIDLGDRRLAFDAIAGAITLAAPDGREEADIAYAAYLLPGAPPGTRPVTFVVNGGPGAASAYLQLGAIGPWRLPIAGPTPAPSQPIALVPNAETWLDFTDLVFVDPVGAGFSRLVEPDDALRARYLSVEGDVAALADFVRRWLTENGRLASPAHFVGESYGGFRGPLLAERLQTEEGIALRSLVLVSPVLDFGWRRQPAHAPLPRAALLPSLAAAAMEAEGRLTPEAMRAVEDYAAGEYLSDLMRGLGDPAALARMTGRVAGLTGLDPEVVGRAAARIDAELFTRERFRDEGRVASAYDATVAGDDPAPAGGGRPGFEPLLDALTAPLTGAMLELHRERLGWAPARRYVLLNRGVSRAWDWGDRAGQPEAVGALSRALALDPGLRALVVHGYTDLVTPYFATELILRQMRPFGPGERVTTAVYPGGHMFYDRDASRAAFRADALRLYGAE